jgi:hypothetical protein
MKRRVSIHRHGESQFLCACIFSIVTSTMRNPFRRSSLATAVAILLMTIASQSAGVADAAAIPRPLQYNKEVVKLSDQTFEHQTQASTGQTTGNWLVWFYTTGDDTIIEGEMPDEDFTSEHNLVLATVHGVLAKETSKRFQLTEFPCFLYFSRRKMYKYTGDLTWDALTEFVRSVHEGTVDASELALDVPPPRSEFVKMVEVLHEARVTHMLFGAFAIIVGLFAMYTRVVAQSMHQIKKKSS